jgi:hypothetical protein
MGGVLFEGVTGEIISVKDSMEIHPYINFGTISLNLSLTKTNVAGIYVCVCV